jgi:hypothetical protein
MLLAQFNYKAMVIFSLDLLLLRQGCRSSQLKKPTGLFLNAVHLASKAHSLLLF